MSNQEPLYKNRFIQDRELRDYSEEDVRKFEMHIERRKKLAKDEKALEEARADLELEDMMATNAVPKYMEDEKSRLLSLSMPPPTLTKDQQQVREVQEIRSVVNIDSKDRDLVLWPNQNDFKVFLGKTFRNVKSIKLLSLEFPNTDLVFKRLPTAQRNNFIRWENQEDIGTANEGVVYIAEINPGNYTGLSIQQELSEQMATIKRVALSGDFHTFEVSVDLDTDIADFTSLTLSSLPNNPISVVNNSSEITVLFPGHTFAVGDRAFLSGITGTIGGIGQGLINGFQTIVEVPPATDLTGTVSVVTGQPYVTGVGSIFLTEVVVSEILVINGETKAVVTVGIQVTGVVSVIAGSATITGSGTAFSSGTGAQKIVVGDTLVINGESKIVVSVDSNTQLTMNSNYAATALNQTAVRNPDTELLMASNYAASATGVIANSPIDSFIFEVSIKALETASGGGNTSLAGKGAPFKFLFGQYTDTVAKNLGFPLEDSSDDVPGVDQIQTFNKPIVSVTVGNPTTITAYKILTGTVDVTLGSAIVIGTNTRFNSEVFTRERIIINGVSKRVLRVGVLMTGTVSVVSDSNVVAGAGTAFTTEVLVGEKILINRELKTITAINSNTELTTDSTFATTVSGVEAVENPDTLLTMESAYAATFSDEIAISGHGLKDGNETVPGTVTIANGSAIVSGIGTAFTKYASVGDNFLIDGVTKKVLSVDSDTQLTMNSNYTATVPFTSTGTASVTSGEPYIIGSGSAFDIENVVGDILTANGETKTVVKVGRDLTGVVAIVSGSAIVSGTGTDFSGEVNVGDTIVISGISKLVSSVDSSTQLTMASAYTATRSSRIATLNPATILTMNSVFAASASGLSITTDSKAAEQVLTADTVRIRNLITIPSITETTDAKFTVQNVNELGTTFEIDYSTTSVNATSFGIATVGLKRVRVNHIAHTLETGNEITLYRSDGVGGLPASEINGKKKPVVVLDDDNYELDFGDVYATSEARGCGSNLRISSRRHGFRDTQTNTSDGTNLNRSISLEGEKYVLMTSPGLDTIFTTNPLVDTDIFAKILLKHPPGTMQYDTFISNAKVFHESPLAELVDMRFTIYDPNGNLFQLNDIDYSFSLEIIELRDFHKFSNYSSRRGVEDHSTYNAVISQSTNAGVGAGGGSGGLKTLTNTAVQPQANVKT